MLIHKKSQAGIILSYLQKHPNKEVTGTDFLGFWFMPFVGISANARLSELKQKGLVEKVGVKKGVMKFFFRSKDRNLYKITELGLITKLR